MNVIAVQAGTDRYYLTRRGELTANLAEAKLWPSEDEALEYCEYAYYAHVPGLCDSTCYWDESKAPVAPCVCPEFEVTVETVL